MLLLSMSGDKPAYKLFASGGKKSDYKDLLKDASGADVVLFGELHDNPICHWLELELAKDLYAEKNGLIILGAEMFETDGQLLLDEYIMGKIKTRNFEAEAKLWDNYKTDYKPLVEFAKEKKLPFIATNIPRRYAAVVSEKGFEGLDSLSASAQSFMAPLPIKYDPELPSYKSMLDMGGMGGMGGMGQPHANPNLPKAQAIKDATMADRILKNLKPGQTLIHYNGSFHSDNYEGIVWYLKQEKPGLKIVTISSVEQPDIEKLDEESTKLADYILCIPESMTKTY
jgi:uncharacterized iron-regulated protein